MNKNRYFLPLLFLVASALLVPAVLGAGLLLGVSLRTDGTMTGALSAHRLNRNQQQHLDKRGQQQTKRQQPTVNMDCTLIVPAHPLSALGLATPYQLTATNPANGPCNESNKTQAAFVQGAIIDPVTGVVSIYNPLVVDRGSQPAVQPQPPFGGQIPQGDIVALWFGSNGNTLILQDSSGSLRQGRCVNGSSGSIFGQFAYCNAPAFFQAANLAMRAGKLVPPPLGMAMDGQTCPTTRDYSIVDQDQSDNVTATYLVTASGQTAQDTQDNAAVLGAQVQKNGSDERLLTLVDAALGCMPWTAPDLANPGHKVPALPLNELQAAVSQGMSVALVPNADPMVLVNNQPNLAKLNAYRAGVDQPPSPGTQASSTRAYCQNLLNIAPKRVLLHEEAESARSGHSEDGRERHGRRRDDFDHRSAAPYWDGLRLRDQRKYPDRVYRKGNNQRADMFLCSRWHYSQDHDLLPRAGIGGKPMDVKCSGFQAPQPCWRDTAKRDCKW